MLFDWLTSPWIAGLIGLLGLAVGSVGTILAMQARKPTSRIIRTVSTIEKAAVRKRNVEWDDVKKAASSVAQSTAERLGSIDVIIAPGARGAIFGQQIGEYLNRPPIVVGVTHKADAPYDEVFERPLTVRNRDWEVEIPRIVKSFRDGKALVVDDYARGGNFMREMRITLCSDEVGFKDDSVICAVVVSTEHAVLNKRVDLWGSTYNDPDLELPWGKAL